MTASGDQSAQTGGDASAEARRLIAGLLQANPHSINHWRRLILALPPSVAVRELSAALQRATTWVEYQRVACLLARIGGPDALEVLAQQIRTNRRWSGIAVRALQLAGGEDQMRLLIELLPQSRRRVALRIAAALARRKYLPGILPICRHRLIYNGGNNGLLRQALEGYGPPHRLPAEIADDPSLTLEAAVETIVALKEAGVLRRLDVQAELDRHAASLADERAQIVARRYRECTTLLRPSDRAPDDTLLRPASGADRTPTDQLLTPSSAAEADEEAKPRAGWLSRAWDAVKDALDGQRQ